jgi:hypothetical protein
VICQKLDQIEDEDDDMIQIHYTSYAIGVDNRVNTDADIQAMYVRLSRAV